MTNITPREAREIWLREAARELRRRSTPTEQLLWQALRARHVAGLRFRRQHPIGPYIADFLCFAARLVVEIDGDIHEDQREYDLGRDDDLREHGYQVLRISADRVERDLPGVLEEIRVACSLSPNLSLNDRA